MNTFCIGADEHPAQSRQTQRTADSAARHDLAEAIMAEGYRSCFGCTHHGQKDICRGCSVLEPRWEASARWLALQKTKGVSEMAEIRRRHHGEA